VDKLEIPYLARSTTENPLMKKATIQKLDQLDIELRNLLRELEAYSEAKLNEQPDEDSWSVFQVMYHLILSEHYSHQYVQKKLSFNPELKKAGFVSELRRMVLNMYLAAPLKFNAPTAVRDNLPEHATFWEIAKKWKDQRVLLRDYLQQLPEDFYDKEIYKHPFAGRLSLDGMLAFFQRHFQRHRKQIFRTLRKVDAVKQR